MEQSTSSQVQPARQEEISVIGGGLGGCLTALMLARVKNPDGSQKYHVNLLEAQDMLLNGTSMIAARLHLGGEYPLDEETGKDCLTGATLWRLLMPHNIYTAAPRMKFLVAENTENSARDKNGRVRKDGLTVNKFLNYYARIRKEYKSIFTQLRDVFLPEKLDSEIITHDLAAKIHEAADSRDKKQLSKLAGEVERRVNNKKSESERDNWEISGKKFFEHLLQQRQEANEQTAKYLFGMPDQFYRPFKDATEWQGYTQVAGGFQSQEMGFNIPRSLATIQALMDEEQKHGNIHIHTSHKVSAIEELNLNDASSFAPRYRIHCENGRSFESSQVVQCAWQGGPAITPLGPDKSMTVYKRGMMIVDLPEGWNTGPAFTMLGEDGGMVAPFNDKIALCYLPGDNAAYRRKVTLASRPERWNKMTDAQKAQWESTYAERLPEDWNRITAQEMETWKNTYFDMLKKRFPVLKGASNPRLVVRDTINFQKIEHERRNEPVAERMEGMAGKLSLRPRPEVHLATEHEFNIYPAAESKPGWFTVYPTKATFGVLAAVQAASMVEERSKNPQLKSEVQPIDDCLRFLLREELDPVSKATSCPNLAKYSLANDMIKMQVSDDYIRDFCQKRPDLDYKMALDSWPGVDTSRAQSFKLPDNFADRHSKGGIPKPRRR